ncbi:type II secretion system protein [Leptolyngbya sp. AN03gr2]|uniref:type II secretion system protein n=1 Tax=unclassified Leptolyngbya TaxID=2650499 RepID=UPI003D31A022
MVLYLMKQMKQQSPSSRQSTLLLRLIQRMSCDRGSDQGLTLIEGLLAIVIISITMVSITPPIFWAVASRVQTQRAEQALKLAQGEIDRVRTIVDRGETTTLLASLPPEVTATTNVRSSVPAPNTPTTPDGVLSTRSCSATASFPPANTNIFVGIDTNGDCVADYLLQTFRSQGLDQNGNPFTRAANQTLSGFVMGVRVYSAVARPELVASRGGTQPAALRGTSGLGNQLNRPLAVLYSTIVRSNDGQNLDLYRKLCPATSSQTGAC